MRLPAKMKKGIAINVRELIPPMIWDMATCRETSPRRRIYAMPLMPIADHILNPIPMSKNNITNKIAIIESFFSIVFRL
jgi:hypothetical protein